ncbi:hypothetical protein [Phenylobacterium sp.]|uniref:hypothetical protein n=1 Tax=Phenylobacterium sp. TaxID=1871053 RepID=UPI0035699624
MTRRILTAALLAALSASLALGACDKPKERPTPPDPFASLPPEPNQTVSTAGLSKGLPRRPELGGFTLDHAGDAHDPLNKQPAVTSAARSILLDGFGFDPIAKAPGKGVDVVIDGKAYGTAYGKHRPDVANYTRTPGLAAVGFSTTLPAGTLGPGPHIALVRVVAADGAGYYESPPIRFEVK